MPLVFAHAGTFTKGKAIPSLPLDTIGIELPHHTCSMLRRMDRKDVVRHFELFEPRDYIMFNERRHPRYSSFMCEVTVANRRYTPIELTPQTQVQLFEMVRDLKEEWSGLLKNEGICNLLEGSDVTAPMQPDRTPDAIPFHTHPVGTYEKFRVNYGLPSITDLKHLHSNPLPSNVVNAQLLLSREGIYTIAKKTCDHVPKVHLSERQFNRVLDTCSFILLPWNFERSWFIF